MWTKHNIVSSITGVILVHYFKECFVIEIIEQIIQIKGCSRWVSDKIDAFHTLLTDCFTGKSTLRMNNQHIFKFPGDKSIMNLLGWCVKGTNNRTDQNVVLTINLNNAGLFLCIYVVLRRNIRIIVRRILIILTKNITNRLGTRKRWDSNFYSVSTFCLFL